ncbi:hypothetical protein VTK73DRAFT_2817 [Phialemonium thermophilum]|uniref:Uncharacterized protein n=1 Tax=Phialemonium thermophilum TaxID=223376 RepID=A0ABR3X2A1_9PEZI
MDLSKLRDCSCVRSVRRVGNSIPRCLELPPRTEELYSFRGFLAVSAGCPYLIPSADDHHVTLLVSCLNEAFWSRTARKGTQSASQKGKSSPCATSLTDLRILRHPA